MNISEYLRTQGHKAAALFSLNAELRHRVETLAKQPDKQEIAKISTNIVPPKRSILTSYSLHGTVDGHNVIADVAYQRRSSPVLSVVSDESGQMKYLSDPKASRRIVRKLLAQT